MSTSWKNQGRTGYRGCIWRRIEANMRSQTHRCAVSCIVRLEPCYMHDLFSCVLFSAERIYDNQWNLGQGGLCMLDMYTEPACAPRLSMEIQIHVSSLFQQMKILTERSETLCSGNGRCVVTRSFYLERHEVTVKVKDAWC